MRVVRDLRERDRQIMAVRNLSGRDVRSPQHPIHRIRDVRHDLGRADAARAQAQRGDQLAESARREHEQILAQLRHPAAAHVVPHHHASASAGKIDGEHGRASRQRNARPAVARRTRRDVPSSSTSRMLAAHADRRDDARTADLESLVRWNRDGCHSSWPLLAPAHRCNRAQQRLRLALRLFPLALGHRVRDDSRARLHRRHAVGDDARADRDREVHPLAAGGDVADRAGVRAARSGSSSSMISIARTFGAPVIVPAGKVARNTSSA